MLFEVTNQIIDAMLDNERRQLGRTHRPGSTPTRIPAPANTSTQKPDWCQLPPGGASA